MSCSYWQEHHHQYEALLHNIKRYLNDHHHHQDHIHHSIHSDNDDRRVVEVVIDYKKLSHCMNVFYESCIQKRTDYYHDDSDNRIINNNDDMTGLYKGHDDSHPYHHHHHHHVLMSKKSTHNYFNKHQISYWSYINSEFYLYQLFHLSGDYITSLSEKDYELVSKEVISNIVEYYMLGLLSPINILDVFKQYDTTKHHHQYHHDHHSHVIDDDIDIIPNQQHHNASDNDDNLNNDKLGRMYGLYQQLYDTIASIESGYMMYCRGKHHITIEPNRVVDDVDDNDDDDDNVDGSGSGDKDDDNRKDDDYNVDNCMRHCGRKVNWLDLLNINSDVMNKINTINNNNVSKRHGYFGEKDSERHQKDRENDSDFCYHNDVKNTTTTTTTMLCANTENDRFNSIQYSLLFYHTIPSKLYMMHWCYYHIHHHLDHHLPSVQEAILHMFEQLAFFSAVFDFNSYGGGGGGGVMMILYFIDTVIQCIDQLAIE